MARTRAVVIIGLAATLAVITAVVFAARISSTGWGSLSRLFRNDVKHPDWELLAQ